MEKELLRLLLNYEFYKDNKHFLTETMFPDTLRELYRLIIDQHNKLEKDLTLAEIKELYKVNHPTISKTAWDGLCMVLDDLPNEISHDVASEIIQKAWLVECGRRLAEAGIQIVNGKEIQITEISKIIEEISTGNLSCGSIIEPVSNELEEILGDINATTQWGFNLQSLSSVCGGVGPGIFTIIVARTEVGKTAFHSSLCAGPKGFAEQGAEIHIFGNEEPIRRLQVRYVMAHTGMNLLELQTDLDKGRELFSKIKDNVKFFDAKGMDISDLDRHCHYYRPSIVVLDQLDKFSIKGVFARTDERLGALYISTREIADKYRHASFAITQASANAEGKTYLSSIDLAESRTAKAAEGDLVLGIGKSPIHDDNTRIINMIKNKLTGTHNDVYCRIVPEISRYIC